MKTIPKEIIIYIIEFLPNYSIQEFMKTSKTNCQHCEVVWKKKYNSLVDGNRLIGFYQYLLGKTKLVYYYRKYSRGLEKYLVDSLKPKICLANENGVHRISHHQKIDLIYECFDLYVQFKDILLHHKSLIGLKKTVQEKLHTFLFERKTYYGSQQAIEIAHKYYPLLFPQIYYLTLVINLVYNKENLVIRAKYGIAIGDSLVLKIILDNY